MNELYHQTFTVSKQFKIKDAYNIAREFCTKGGFLKSSLGRYKVLDGDYQDGQVLMHDQNWYFIMGKLIK